MNRRRFIIGLGTLAAGSGVAVGSGAFSTIEAERTVTVETVGDRDAYLQLEAVGSDARARNTGDEIRFNIPDKLNEPDEVGVGADSIYQFGQDSETDESGLFEVTNQGTQTVSVYSDHDAGSTEPQVDIYAIDTDDVLDSPSNGRELDNGTGFKAGLQIDTHGTPVEDGIVVNLPIKAEVVE